jgi:hypothetical protein
MSDTMDPDTGELPFVPNGGAVAAHALSVARAERADRFERRYEKIIGPPGLNQKIDAALATIQPVLKHNKLEKEKTGQRGNYTSLDRIVSILVPKLRTAGVMVRWSSGHVFNMDKAYWLPVSCYLIDRDTADSIECTLPLPVSQVTPHGVVSAFTYGRRVTVLGATGLVTGDDGEDDNAEGAMPREMKVASEVEELIRECRENETEAEATKWKAAVHKRLEDLDPKDFETVKVAFQDHVKALRAAPAKAKK